MSNQEIEEMLETFWFSDDIGFKELKVIEKITGGN